MGWRIFHREGLAFCCRSRLSSNVRRHKDTAMTTTCTLLTVGLLAFSTTAIGKDVACAPRAEIGETTSGEHIYEREADLKLKNLSRIDFDNLTILSAEGRKGLLVV